MGQKERRNLLKALALILIDSMTVWIMVVLYGLKAAYFPWCISYLFLAVGLVNISALFYRGLSKEIHASFAAILLASSGVLWGYTVTLTFVTIAFPLPALYHGLILAGITLYTCYNLIMLRRLSKDPVDKLQDNHSPSKELESVPVGAGPDTAVMVLNLGECMISLRSYLSAEDYAQLEKSYWSTVESVKNLPQIDPAGPQDLLEIEKRIKSKLSEIHGHMQLIQDAPGDIQRVLLTGVITSFEIVKNFAINMERIRNNKQ